MKLERPKRNVARAWSLPPGSTFIALPHAVLRLLIRSKLEARHVVTMLAIADVWHAEEGPIFRTSLRALSEAIGLPYQNVNRALSDIADAGLIEIERVHGRPLSIDMRPILRLLAKASKRTVPSTEQRTVPRTEQNCSTTVPPTERNCSTSEPEVATDFRDRVEEVASLAGAPENGNGHGNGKSAAQIATVQAALQALTAPKRHPRAIDGESYADTQKRLAEALELAEKAKSALG